jgi:hypothetical protein
LLITISNTGTADLFLGRCLPNRFAGLAFAAVAVSWCVGSAASADPMIEWNVPSSCPSKEAFLADVASASAVSNLGNIPMAIRMQTSQLPDGSWNGSLILGMEGSEQQRHLEAATCGGVVSGAAVIVAALLDELTLDAKGEASRTIASVGVVGNPNHRFDMISGAIAGLALIGDVGSLPGAPATGGDLAVGWYRARSKWRFRVWLDGSYFLPRSTQGTGIQGRFSVLAADARGCATVPLLNRVEIGGCMGAGVDRVHGIASAPSDVVQALPSSSTAWDGLAGPLVAFHLTDRVSLSFATDCLFFVRRDTFVVKPDNATVFQPANFVIRTAVGLELRFL